MNIVSFFGSFRVKYYQSVQTRNPSHPEQAIVGETKIQSLEIYGDQMMRNLSH